MSDGDTVLAVHDAGKRFCRRLGRSLRYGAADIARELIGLQPPAALRRDEFWAVDGVSFALRRGECLGLIGANGAGKSTLLKMIAGLIKPDRGSITVRGRVGALIELGAGMHPLLSGRENIRLNAAILGLSGREVAARMEEIIAFAGIGDFIDAPVQSYSSGMRVRLGFAVAAHLEPDLLLIDEVLAVGDAAFRARCYERIDHLRDRAAVVFVSHQEQQVARLCDRVVLLDRGRQLSDGPVADGFLTYARRSNPATTFSHEAGAAVSCVVLGRSNRQLRLRLTIATATPPEDLMLLLTVLSSEQAPLLAFRERAPVVGAPFERTLDLATINQRRILLSLTLRDRRGRMLFWHHAFHAAEIDGVEDGVAAPVLLPLGA